MADPDWKINLDAWKARQTITSEASKTSEGRSRTRTDFQDVYGLLAREIIENKFSDYLNPGPGRKVVNENPETSAIADYAPYKGILRPPKSRDITQWTHEGGRQYFTDIEFTTDEVIDTTFVMLHELTHARTPPGVTVPFEGAPSESAVRNLVSTATKSNKFLSQGVSGNITELVASLLPIRDMNARGIRPTVGIAGKAQKGYDELISEFSWLPEYLDAQSKPEQKFYRDSPKIQAASPPISETVKNSLRSIFGVSPPPEKEK